MDPLYVARNAATTPGPFARSVLWSLMNEISREVYLSRGLGTNAFLLWDRLDLIQSGEWAPETANWGGWISMPTSWICGVYEQMERLRALNDGWWLEVELDDEYRAVWTSTADMQRWIAQWRAMPETGNPRVYALRALLTDVRTWAASQEGTA